MTNSAPSVPSEKSAEPEKQDATSESIATIRLKKNEERRLLAGHLWVFSNEVDIESTPLKTLTPGQTVVVQSANGRELGFGYANPQSLITARLCSARRAPNADWLRNQLQNALALRTELFDKPFYRLVHGEGDYLPGLVIDRFGDVLVVQITTAGMEKLKDELLELLVELVAPTTIMLNNDNSIRKLEGLSLYRTTHLNEPDSELLVEENGYKFQVCFEHAQKTGWFYDHRANRASVARLCDGKRVLDVYAYAGAWGINALGGGASSVLAIDSSAPAMEAATKNADLNGFADRFEAQVDDGVEAMRTLGEKNELFDVIILDPPAFIKRKKDYKQGLQHYALNHKLAMKLLSPSGFLVTASCSQSMSADALSSTIQRAAARQNRQLRVVEQFGQGPDHPVHPSMPETHYLDGLVVAAPLDQ